MSNLTVAQVVEVLIKLVGGCLLIVALSFPIMSAARFIAGQAPHPAPVAQLEDNPRKAESWIPAPLSRILGAQKPANTLVPPPPPLMF